MRDHKHRVATEVEAPVGAAGRCPMFEEFNWVKCRPHVVALVERVFLALVIGMVCLCAGVAIVRGAL